MRTRKLAGLTALAAMVAVGLAGCVKMDMSLDLQPDDTVDGSVTFAIDKSIAEMMGESPESLAESMRDDSVDLASEFIVRTEAYDDGTYIGSTVYLEGSPLSEFQGGPDELSIVREGDEFVVSGRFDMGEGGDDFGMMPTDGFDITISVTFPGAVSEHNGQLNGRTVSWKPAMGEATDMQARGSAIAGGGDSGLPLPLIIAIAAALLVLIGLVLFFVLRRKSPQEPAAATALGDGTAPAAPGPGAPPPPPANAPPPPPPAPQE
jgi:hypothetical protein